MSDSAKTSVRVAVVRPVREAFSYSVPERLSGKAVVGCPVSVPFGKSEATGYIIAEESSHPGQSLLPVRDVLDREPLFHAKEVPFFEWLADYYLYPIGPLIQSVLPVAGRGGASFSARLTGEGRGVLSMLPPRSLEGKILAWIRDNPGKRPPFHDKDIRILEKKGLLERSFRKGSRGPGGPQMQRFIRPARNVRLEDVLGRRSESIGAPNELDFLSEVFLSGGMRLRDLKGLFQNADYLVRKWTKKGLIQKYDAPVLVAPTGNVLFPAQDPHPLSMQQEDALGEIKGLLKKGTFSACLVYGVTGSGKTEVYYRAVLETIESGRRAILLVPEISLAAYVEGVFRSRFGERVAVYHSGLSKGERYAQWIRIARGDVDIVIGARSALFAPLPRIGLIIVDEEHDFSYKQGEAPRYQARDAAVVRARIEGALAVLGSGTPSVQSFHNALTGKYRMISMPERVRKRPLPAVEVIDVKKTLGRGGLDEVISPELRNALEDTLSKGNQSLLFLNRRGFHRVFLCRQCGEAVRCPNCDLALIHHFREHILACHYCGHQVEPVRRCASCGSREMRAFGFGTERLEIELGRLFPTAAIARMDRDSTRLKGSAFKILKKFGAGEIDILVGTQMITKGYDFPKVTLVGVIAADASLGFPDFRASERTFQLLCQVAGRSGRGDTPGRVLVQTLNPGHYAIECAESNDYRTFFGRETQLRKQLGYPPFSYLARLVVQGTRKEIAGQAARRLGEEMEALKGKLPRGPYKILVLGPVEAPLARIKGKFRWQLLVKCPSAEALHRFLTYTETRYDRLARRYSVNIVTDVDPYQML